MPLSKLVSRSVLTVTAMLAMSVAAGAAGDPAAERQALMKNVGAATKAGAAMAKGEVPFDAVAAQLVMRTMNNAGLAFGYMFPEGSETGSETEASPKIWEDRAGFEEQVNKFIADTGVEVTDEEGFKTAFGTATKNCGACHENFRVKK